MKTMKKITGLLLAMLMLMSCLGTGVSAADLTKEQWESAWAPESA